MKVGVMMHVTDATISPADLAVEAESRGFDSVFVTEHTHIPVQQFIRWRGGEPMPEEYKRLHDPVVALATAAAATSRIRLGTGVLIIGQREPIALAKQLASLDTLSGGRLIVGTGYGWLRNELANHGIAWADRQAVWAEHVSAISALWRDDEAAFDGDRIRFDPVWSYPKPIQRPRPPILLGSAGTDNALRQIVAAADGWLPIEGAEDIPGRWRRLVHLAEDAGRDPAGVQLVVYGSAGDPIIADTYQELGATSVIVGLAGDVDVRAQLDHHHALIERYSGSKQ